jgi:hypothetical protein
MVTAVNMVVIGLKKGREIAVWPGDPGKMRNVTPVSRNALKRLSRPQKT